MTELNEINQRLKFFEDTAEIKSHIAKSESDRLKLEIELNRLMNSDDAIAKSKAQKLKIYFGKLCDEEAKSAKRNQQLLNDIQRVDIEFQKLEKKLDRLNNLKKECEAYLKTAYPTWTNEKRLFDETMPVDYHPSQITPNKILTANVTHNKNPDYYSEVYNFNEQAGVSKNLNSLIHSFVPTGENNGPLRTKPATVADQHANGGGVLKNLVYNPMSPNPPMSTSPKKATNSPKTRVELVQRDVDIETESPDEYVKKLVSSATNNLFVDTTTPRTAPRTVRIDDDYDNDFNAPQLNANNNENYLKQYEQELQRRETNTMDFNASSTALAAANFNHNQMLNESNLIDEGPGKSINQLNTWSSSQSMKNLLEQAPKASSTQSESDLKPNQINSSDMNNKFKFDANESTKTKKRISFRLQRQELTLDSLYYLLDYIELEISHTIHPEKYYRQVEPHYKNKLEIIRLARENKPLDEMDPADISMVILDQLATVIDKHTKNRCLFTRDLLGLSVTDVNEKAVTASLKDPSDRQFWERLVKHWTFLKRVAYIDSNQLARLFAPSMLGLANGTGVEKGVKILENIVNELVNGANNNHLLGSLNDSKSLTTETSINHELMVASSSKLKESSVYQDFIMNNTQGSNKSKSDQQRFNKARHHDDDDDDDDDDIDEMVAPKSIMSTNSSAKKIVNQTASILKSPRGTNEFDMDHSQVSISDSQKAPKVLQSIRSNTDKKQIPVYLRSHDSDDESSETSLSQSAKNTTNRSQRNDMDFDFYN